MAFRETLATLYDVVVSDFQYRPRDRLEFQAWLEEQDRAFLDGLGVKSQAIRARVQAREVELHGGSLCAGRTRPASRSALSRRRRARR